MPDDPKSFWQRAQDAAKALQDSLAEVVPGQDSVSEEVRRQQIKYVSDQFARAKQFGKDGILHTLDLFTGRNDPYMIPHMMEGAGDVAKGLFDSIVGAAAKVTNNTLQAISPVDLNKTPGMAGVFPSPDDARAHASQAVGENIPIAGAIGKQLNDNYQEATKDLLPDATASQRFVKGVPAAIGKTTKAILQPPISLVTGQDADGNPLNTRDATKAMIDTWMLAGGAAGAVGYGLGELGEGGVTEMLEGTEPPTSLKNLRSVGEMRAAETLREQSNAEQAQAALGKAAKNVVEEQKLPEGTDLAAGGSSVPINQTGKQHATELASKVPDVDKIYYSPSLRGQQTADIIGKITSADTVPHEGFGPPQMGALEGQPSEIATPIHDNMAKAAPDQPLPGAGPLNTAPGESWQDWHDRFKAGVKDVQDAWQSRVEAGEEVPKIGVITHSKNLELLQAMTDKPDIESNVPQGEMERVGPPKLSGMQPGQPGIEMVTNPDLDRQRTLIHRDEQGQPTGYLQFYTDDARTGPAPPDHELYPEVYVDPAARRNGVATRLYDEAAKQGFDLSQVSGNETTPEGAAFVTARNRSQMIDQYKGNHSGDPATMYHYAPDADGSWKLSEAQDSSAPGVYFMRHGNTDWDGPIGESNIGKTPRQVPYGELEEGWRNTPQEWKDRYTQDKQMSTEGLSDLQRRVILDPVGRSSLLEHMNQGDAPSLAMTRILHDEQVGKDIITDMTSARGAMPGEIQDALHTVVAGVFENTKSKGGADVASFADTMQKLQTELDYQAHAATNLDDAARAQSILKDLRRMSEISAGRIGDGPAAAAWSKVAGYFRKAEKLRIGSMISPIKTAANIALGQFGLLGGDFSDAAMTGLVNTFRQPFVSPTSPLASSTNAFADLTELAKSSVARLPLAGRMGFDDITDTLDALPGVKKELGEGLLFDGDAHMFPRMAVLMNKAKSDALLAGGSPADYMSSFKKGWEKIKDNEDLHLSETPGKTLYNVANGAVDFFLAPNRWQEAGFRKLAFDARYRSNLDNIGMSYENALHELNRNEITQQPMLGKKGNVLLDEKTGQPKYSYDVKEISPKLREAVTDALEHSLRQTYAFTPTGGMFGGMLEFAKVSNKFLPMSMWGPTFPRAIVNNLMWQVHHSPLGIADLLTPEFADAFMGLKDELTPEASRDASRKIGKVMTGMIQMNLALHLANGGEINGWKNGPKPWLLTNGDKDKQGKTKFWDISGQQPLNSYAVLADQIMSHVNGRPSTVSPEDVLQNIANIDASDTPIFKLDSTLRQLKGNGDGSIYKALTDDFGKYLGGFATIGRGIREEFAAIPPQWRSLAVTRGVNSMLGLDTKTGYARKYQPNALPDAMLGPLGQGLDKIDAMTGFQDREQHPLMALGKIERKGETPLQQLLEATPGYDPNTILKTYDDPHATMLVRQAFGSLVGDANHPYRGMRSTQDMAAALLPLNNPTLNEMFLKDALAPAKEFAEKQAMLWDMAADAKARGLDDPRKGNATHFAKEIADAVNKGKVPTTQKFIEDLVKNIKSPQPNPQQTLQP